ncbi:unnamed protein product [Dovyalis caffra]|uniref:AT-hook motif nuclear-localized protein n=1 Tax=Dovyalis caffra TaxID=77055 RepID=A0AAV1SQT5_9ROSI|nr:unnamed protein product [Dovyalis caffra]
MVSELDNQQKLNVINGQHHRAGGLTVTLARSDGSILGGSVAGLLRASSLVQVIVASFTTQEERDSKLRNKLENLSTWPKLAQEPSTVGSSASHGTLNQSFVQPRFPFNQSTGP